MRARHWSRRSGRVVIGTVCTGRVVVWRDGGVVTEVMGEAYPGSFTK